MTAISLASSPAVCLFERQLLPGSTETPTAAFDPRVDSKLAIGSDDDTTLLAWSADSSRLALCTAGGGACVLSREGQLIADWGPKPWGKQRVVGLSFLGSAAAVALLTSQGRLFKWEPQQAAPQQVASVKGRAKCMVFAPASEELLVVGADGNGQPCFYGWRLSGTGGSQLLWQAGSASAPWFSWGSPSGSSAWDARLSISGTWLAVAVPGSPMQLHCVEALKAGRQEAEHLLPEAASLSWWSEELLASVSSAGACCVCHATANEQKDLLMPTLTGLSSGAGVACQRAAAGAPNRMLLVHQSEEGGGWVVTALTESPASEKLRQLLTARQWDAATLLAKAHGLDTDRVVQGRWEAQEVDAAAIRDSWAAVRNRQWAVASCLDRLASSEANQRLLLQAGLAETEAVLSAAPGGPGERLAWLGLRIRLLEQLDRLALLTRTLAREFSPAAYEGIRAVGIVNVALQLAASSRLAELQALLQACPYRLSPRLLEILAALPEALPPQEWLPLLRQELARKAPALSRQPDSVETAEVAAELEAAGEFALATATEPLARLHLKWRPPSLAAVGRWFSERAVRVDAVTGLLPLAAAVVAAGLEVVGDDEALLETQQRARELTAAAAAGPGVSVWRLELGRYAARDAVGRLRLLLEGCSVDTVTWDAARLRSVLEALPELEWAANLSAAVAQEAGDRLEWCCQLFAQEAAALKAFPSATALAEAALACIDGFQGTEDWGSLARIADSAAAALRGAAAAATDGWEVEGEELFSQESKTEELRSQVLRAQLLVQGGELLAELGAPLPLPQLARFDREAAFTHLRTLLGRLARSNPPESRWTEVWQRLRRLQETAWQFLSKQDLLVELCRSLLACGQWRLARGYLTGSGSTPIPPEIAQEVVVAAARDYLYSAASLDAPEVAQAQKCLAVLPASKAAAAEALTIQGLLLARDLGVDLPPLQLRQLEDGMEVVQAVLDARPGAYLQREKVAAVAEKLGVRGGPKEFGLRIAAAALKEGDISVALSECMGLLRAGYQPAWQLCLQLASLTQRMDVLPADARDLLGFAMAHCPPDQVPALLQLWREAPWQQTWASSPESTLTEALSPASAAVLPDFGDAALAVHTLFQAGEHGKDVLEACLAAHSEEQATSRRLMLLGLSTSALQVVKAKDGTAEAHLTWGPWQLHAAVSEVAPEALPPAAQNARLQALEWGRRLSDAGDERRMEAWLREAEDADLDSGDARANALLRAATTAGRSGPAGEQQLQQVLAMAERHKIESTPLRLGFLRGLVAESEEAPDALERSALPIISWLRANSQGKAAVQLHDSLWAGLDGGQHSRCALCLKLIASCLEDSGAAAAATAAAAFAATCSNVAPSIDCKLFLDRVVAATIGIVPLSDDASKPDMEAAVAAHVEAPVAAEFGSSLAALASAVKAAGVRADLPTASHCALCSFCGEVSRGSADFGRCYAGASKLLPQMGEAQVLAAVSFVALGGDPPVKGSSRLKALVPRSIRLRALEDGLQLVKGQNESLSGTATLLRRVEHAAAAGSLSDKEAECLEAALMAGSTGAAVQKLLCYGVPLGRLEAAVDSLEGAGGNDSVLENAVRDSVAECWQRGEDVGLENVLRSLEDGAARTAPAARMAAWQQLQADALKKADGPLAVLGVGLLASLLPSDSSDGRWERWTPPAGAGVDAAAVALWARSQALLREAWPGGILQPADLSSAAAAQAAFLRLLDSASTSQQLQALHHLLASLWQDGRVLPPPLPAPPAAPQPVARQPSLAASQAPPKEPVKAAAMQAREGGNGWQYDSVDFDALGLDAGPGGEEAGLDLGAPPDETREGWQYDSVDFDGLDLATAEADGQAQQSEAIEEEDAAPLHACWAALLTAELRLGLVAEALQALDAAPDKLVTCAEAANVYADARDSGNAEAATLALLLPCPEVQELAVAALASADSGEGTETLLLVLLAKGLLPVLAGGPGLSLVCHLMLQHPQLDPATWRGMLLPAAACQLVLSGHLAQACDLAASLTGLHPALASRNNSVLLLQRYLTAFGKVAAAERLWEASEAPLPRTARTLWQSCGGLCKQAVGMLKGG